MARSSKAEREFGKRSLDERQRGSARLLTALIFGGTIMIQSGNGEIWGQQVSGGGPADINKQVVSMTAFPPRVELGDSLIFTYKVYTDTLPPISFLNPEVKLTVRTIADIYPSLVESRFRHLASYILRADTLGDRRGPDTTKIDFPRVIAEGFKSVTYRLPTVQFDTSRHVADTLSFRFSYRLPDTLENLTCLRLLAGVDAEFTADDEFDTTRISFGKLPATSEVETASRISMSVVLDPPPPPGGYDIADSFAIRITYSNTGNVSDALRFEITIPSGIDTNNVVFESLVLQPNAFVDLRYTDLHHLAITDNPVPPGTVREIVIPFKLDLVEVDSETPEFVIRLISRCDADTTARQPFGVALANLLSVRKRAAQETVSPGDTLDYTLEIRRLRTDVRLDSVFVVDTLPPGIAEILEVNPPASQVSNFGITWQLLDFSDTSRSLSFRAVLRRDFYPTVYRTQAAACSGVSISNSVLVRAQQNDPGELHEGVVGDNDDTLKVRVRPLGDVLSVATKVSDLNTPGIILPGDVLQFVVRFQNVNTFANSGAFTLTDTLPSLQYLSAPFDIVPPRAEYDPATNTITLDSLTLASLNSDSLLFRVQVREDTLYCRDDTVRNVAQLTLAGLDCELANNRAVDTFVISDPQATLSMRTDIPLTEADPNDIVDLFVIYQCGATSLIPIRNLTIESQLDPSMTLVSSNPPPVDATALRLTWPTLEDLAPGQADSIKIKIRLNASQPCQADTLWAFASIRSSPPVCELTQVPRDSIFLNGVDDLIDINQITITPAAGAALNASLEEQIRYSFTIVNNSPLPAQGLVVSDTLPPNNQFVVDVNNISGGGQLANGVILWDIPSLAPGQSQTFSFEGNLVSRLYCSPDSISNVFSLRPDPARFPDCAADAHRTVHQIIATPEELQPKLFLSSYAFEDRDGDRQAEPNELVTLRLLYENRESFDLTGIRFDPGTLVALAGDLVVPMQPCPDNPTTIAAGQSATLCLTFLAPRVTQRDIFLFVDGLVLSDRTCPRSINFPLVDEQSRAKFATKGAPQLELLVDLTDTNGDLFASEEEVLNATITLQHADGSQFDADSLTLNLSIDLVPPGGGQRIIVTENVSDSLVFKVPTLARGEVASRVVAFRYPDFDPNQQFVRACGHYTIQEFQNGIPTPVASDSTCDMLRIKHECFAKPRTFIPSAHAEGLKFKPDDNLDVVIIDVEGNKVWEGSSSDVWHGRTKDDRELPPGTYIYVIEDKCKGTITLLR